MVWPMTRPDPKRTPAGFRKRTSCGTRRVSIIGLVMLTATEKDCVGEAVGINKNVRTPASFYYLLDLISP